MTIPRIGIAPGGFLFPNRSGRSRHCLPKSEGGAEDQCAFNVVLLSSLLIGDDCIRDFRESTVAAAEKQYLEKLMARTHGDVATACRISGLSRPKLYSLLKKYEISRTG